MKKRVLCLFFLSTFVIGTDQLPLYNLAENFKWNFTRDATPNELTGAYELFENVKDEPCVSYEEFEEAFTTVVNSDFLRAKGYIYISIAWFLLQEQKRLEIGLI